MKSLWCERVVILLLPVLAIGIETPRRRVSIRPADDARICCPFQGDSRVFGREAAGGDWTIRLEWRFGVVSCRSSPTGGGGPCEAWWRGTRGVSCPLYVTRLRPCPSTTFGGQIGRAHV